MPGANINDAKCIFIVGAAAGIGRALALAIHDLPSKPTVIVSGRRKKRLVELCQKSARFTANRLDLAAGREALKEYVDELVSTYPQLDAILLASGVQHIFNFKRPEEVDLDLFEQEFNTNYISMVALIKFFMPHFLERSAGPHVPGYCATKAALHSFALSLNHQLQSTKVQIMEILPPLTESELHDHQGTTPRLSKSWMPLDEFVKEAMEGLSRGDLLIGVGSAREKLEKYEDGKVEAVSQAPPTPD